MKKIIVCTNHRANPSQPSCAARGSLALADRIGAYIREHHLNIVLEHGTCLGQCSDGPNLKLSPDGPLLSHLTPAQEHGLLTQLEQFCMHQREGLDRE